MNDRQRILASIRGETPDRLPFVPRLEFWHRACRASRTLPSDLDSLTLMEIADRIGVSYYAVVPDFTDCTDDKAADRELGIIHQPVLPFRVSLEKELLRMTAFPSFHSG